MQISLWRSEIMLQLSMHLCHCWHPPKAPAVGRSPMWTHKHHSYAVGHWQCASCSCVLRGAGSGPGRDGDVTGWCAAMPNQDHCSSSCSKAFPPTFCKFLCFYFTCFQVESFVSLCNSLINTEYGWWSTSFLILRVGGKPPLSFAFLIYTHTLTLTFLS